MAIVRTARAGWLAASALAAACFKDDGPPPLDGEGTSTGAPVTTEATTAEASTGAAATSTSGESSSGEPTTDPPAVCGNNVIEAPIEACDDGNTIDTDACRADCRPAECGDGVVWEGTEECDDGAANHPTLPNTCRPGCVKPKCGDGGIYVGALGPPIDVGGGPGMTVQSDDAPRAIGALADGTFRVLWRSDDDADQVLLQSLAADGQPTGTPINILSQFVADARDPVLAVAGNGDVLVAWEVNSNAGDLRARAMVGGDLKENFVLHQSTGGIQDAASLALFDGGAAVAAFLGSKDGESYQVYMRHFADVTNPGGAPIEAIVSANATGVAHPPTVATRPTGEFVVAWGEPAGTMVYRRFAPDGGSLGGQVATTLRVGGGSDGAATKQWTGAALRPDGRVAIVGVDAGGHLALQLFDAADAPAGTVQVAETDALYYPYVDVAADPVGNLTVAWVGCGAPGDGTPSCSTLPQLGAVRWFYADLTPFAAQATVFEKMVQLGSAVPVGLAVAPSGAAAVTYVEGDRALVRVAPVLCP